MAVDVVARRRLTVDQTVRRPAGSPPTPNEVPGWTIVDPSMDRATKRRVSVVASRSRTTDGRVCGRRSEDELHRSHQQGRGHHGRLGQKVTAWLVRWSGQCPGSAFYQSGHLCFAPATAAKSVKTM